MSGKVKETAGFVKEEFGEMIGDRKMAQKGRALRNEGKIEQGELPKMTPVGKGN